MIRVVHLISGLMYGGGQKVALDLLQGLKAWPGIDAELWLLGCRHDVLRHSAAYVAPYAGNYASPATLLGAAGSLRAQLDASRVNIVHSHGWDADVIAYLATLGRPERRVVHLHVTPAWVFSGAPQHAARRFLSDLMFSDPRMEVLAVANAVREHWARAFPKLAARVKVIHNAVDPIGFHPAAPTESARASAITFGAACRLSPQKGLAVLLAALPLALERSNTPIVLKLAGEGAERERLERVVRDLHLSAQVEFLGHVSDVASFYRALDALVLPAVSDEGLPLTILEAMATGLPVITTNTGGAAEAVRDGVDGLVVQANAPQDLARAMAELANDAELRARMGASALHRARSAFSPATQVETIAARYAALLDISSATAREQRRTA